MDFILVRAVFIILFGLGAAWFRPTDVPFIGAALFGAAVAGIAIAIEMRADRISLRRLIGTVAGALIGLICAALVSLILSRATNDAGVVSLLDVSVLLLFGYLGAAIGASKSELLNMSAFGGLFGIEQQTQRNFKILDTSVVIDGRIADIADTGFLDGVLVIPQFVLHELQMVADSADSMKRNRGRRGLDILQRIQKMAHLKVQIVEDDFPQVREVDMKLIELAKVYNCKIVTNDFNLNKVAQLRGVEVLNINELANSLKPIVLPGELMRVFILKEGKEYNQGVAYLDDGTMVVVDNARRMISKTIDISVTSVLQTTAGKMIFGKYDERLQSAGMAERQDRPPRREQAVGEN